MAAVVEAPTEVEKVPLTNAGIPDWGLDAVGGEVKFRFKLDRDDESRGQCVVVRGHRSLYICVGQSTSAFMTQQRVLLLRSSNTASATGTPRTSKQVCGS